VQGVSPLGRRRSRTARPAVCRRCDSLSVWLSSKLGLGAKYNKKKSKSNP